MGDPVRIRAPRSVNHTAWAALAGLIAASTATGIYAQVPGSSASPAPPMAHGSAAPTPTPPPFQLCLGGGLEPQSCASFETDCTHGLQMPTGECEVPPAVCTQLASRFRHIATLARRAPSGAADHGDCPRPDACGRHPEINCIDVAPPAHVRIVVPGATLSACPDTAADAAASQLMQALEQHCVVGGVVERAESRYARLLETFAHGRRALLSSANRAPRVRCVRHIRDSHRRIAAVRRA